MILAWLDGIRILTSIVWRADVRGFFKGSGRGLKLAVMMILSSRLFKGNDDGFDVLFAEVEARCRISFIIVSLIWRLLIHY